MVKRKETVLFICTHNSVRSQMAEALLNRFHGDRYSGYSAGTKPVGVNPFAVEVLAEMGIDISKNRSKSVEEFIDMGFDYVVTVCERARTDCPVFPGAKKIIHAGFPYPAALHCDLPGTVAGFRRLRDEIKDWIDERFE